jgi:hypothetical protein
MNYPVLVRHAKPRRGLIPMLWFAAVTGVAVLLLLVAL